MNRPWFCPGLRTRGRRYAVASVGCLVMAACSRPAPEAPAPVPPPPVMEPVSPPPPTTMVAPGAASGTYRLRVEIQSGNTPPPRQRNAPASQIVLQAQPAAVPALGAPSGSQFNASVAMPGYTRAPRGRTGQAASWWPIGGDSVVVQFAQGNRGQVQLRGALHGTVLRGEIWYLSLETGSTFQMGTFSAARQR